MTAPNGSVYRVLLSGQVGTRLRELYRRAKAQGQGQTFLTAVKAIISRLRSDPVQFGEIRFTLRHLALDVRVAVLPPVVVIYGVHAERHLVFVRDVLWLPQTES